MACWVQSVCVCSVHFVERFECAHLCIFCHCACALYYYSIMQDVSDYEFAHDFPVRLNYLLGLSLCVRCYCYTSEHLLTCAHEHVLKCVHVSLYNCGVWSRIMCDLLDDLIPSAHLVMLAEFLISHDCASLFFDEKCWFHDF